MSSGRGRAPGLLVIDASAILELVLGTPRAPAVEAFFTGASGRVAAPHLVDLELAQVLRRLVGAGQLSDRRARDALVDVADLRVLRWPHAPLLGRVWQLRGHLTAYDAAYVVLAERLEASLLTSDARLAAAPGHRVRVYVAT